MKCPRCKQEMKGYPAISRRDNKTEICSQCGTQEAIFDFQVEQTMRKLNDNIENEKRWLE